MFFTKTFTALLCLFCMQLTYGQQTERKKINAKRITSTIKIDGVIDEPEWKNTSAADKFVALRPTPFQQESTDNASQVYFLYNDEGNNSFDGDFLSVCLLPVCKLHTKQAQQCCEGFGEKHGYTFWF